MPDATLETTASPEWAALRLWATAIRDNARESDSMRFSAKTLTNLLDIYLDLAPRMPNAANHIWVSCMQLANKMAGEKKGKSA